ncbi:hypothetical protein V494_06681 [Pseudogymnoascus sp. VKM F-4513 (FW-928)]|nr:hypothetical protein V494_06681 [Pseudogymnoascus sp. VKM F-4513 (FW-928)]
MKLLALLLGASVVVARIASDECRDRYLFFNHTNVADLVECAEFAYYCANGSTIVVDGTNGDVPPAKCTKRIYVLYYEQPDVTGPIELPGVVEVNSIVLTGGYVVRDNITTVTTNATHDTPGLAEKEPLGSTEEVWVRAKNTIPSLDLPNLVHVSSGGIFMENMTNLSRLSVPKLENISGRINLNLSDGPAINLSFPKLYRVDEGIIVNGKIDALDFPVLNSSHHINVTTTGDLDCAAFAKRVVNTTVWPLTDGDYDHKNSSVVCNSNKASVTIYPVPEPTPDESGGSRSGSGLYGTNGKPMVIEPLVRRIIVRVNVEHIDDMHNFTSMSEDEAEGSETEKSWVVRDLRRLLKFTNAEMIRIEVRRGGALDGSDLRAQQKDQGDVRDCEEADRAIREELYYSKDDAA